jgi:hypothetical protein
MKKECYGTMFPNPIDQTPNAVHQGKVLSFVVRSSGLERTGSEMLVDEKQWEECTQCPEYRTCFDLSSARFQLQAAIA